MNIEEWGYDEEEKDDKILETLTELYYSEVSDVKEEVDSLRMTFAEWTELTNKRFEGVNYRDFTEEQLKMYENKVDISYDEFLEVSAKCRQYWSRHDSNTAKVARNKREYFMENEKNIDEATLERFGLGEKEVERLEKIEKLWEDVKLKYDPIGEFGKICKGIEGALSYNFGNETKEVLQEYIEQFKKCTQYIGEESGKNKKMLNIEEEIVVSLEDVLKVIEQLEQSEKLDVEDFIYKFDLDKEEVFLPFKETMEDAQKGFSNKGSIMANEGRAFALDEKGELVVIDEAEAKKMIVKRFFPEKILDSQITIIKNGREVYPKLLNDLEYNKKYGFDLVDEDEILLEEISETELEYKNETPSLEEMSEAELEEMIAENETALAENDKNIKEELIKTILQQQETIREQEKEINRLKSERVK